MEEKVSVEQRLINSERLLKGQKQVLTFDEGCEFALIQDLYVQVHPSPQNTFFQTSR